MKRSNPLPRLLKHPRSFNLPRQAWDKCKSRTERRAVLLPGWTHKPSLDRARGRFVAASLPACLPRWCENDFSGGGIFRSETAIRQDTLGTETDGNLTYNDACYLRFLGFVGYNRKHEASNDLKGSTLESRYKVRKRSFASGLNFLMRKTIVCQDRLGTITRTC